GVPISSVYRPFLDHEVLALRIVEPRGRCSPRRSCAATQLKFSPDQLVRPQTVERPSNPPRILHCETQELEMGCKKCDIHPAALVAVTPHLRLAAAPFRRREARCSRGRRAAAKASPRPIACRSRRGSLGVLGVRRPEAVRARSGPG